MAKMRLLALVPLLAAAAWAAEFADETAAAQKAFGALQSRLQARLLSELEKGGPAKAVRACRVEAPKFAAEAALKGGFPVGRTSHKLRNPKNAPREWVKPYLLAAAGKKAAAVSPAAVDLGGSVGVLKPIPVAGLCLRCHAAPERLDPKLKKVLAKSYPKDEAVGFSEGDFRGFFWAEVPKKNAVK